MLSPSPAPAALVLSPSSWVLRCPVLFNGTNYRDWVSRMRLHIHGLRLWDFLTGEFPCLPSPSAPAQPVISKKTTAAEKEKLLADYEDRLTSYESQFHAYMTWLDEDARVGSVLTASMEDRFVVDIVDFEWTHQMWSFLHQKYESTGQSTYLATICQEQLLRQGDTTVEDFFDQLSVVWCQLDTLGPQLSPATCQSCRDQTAIVELRRTYDFLTRLHDEFEPLRAQLLPRHPYVSLMDALVEVRNEEIRLRDAGLLQFGTVLAARSSAGRSSSARPAASVPLASPPVVPPAARGESGGIHCDHCGRDGHVEAFCYRKKKAQKA
jgi:hypothetical protein